MKKTIFVTLALLCAVAQGAKAQEIQARITQESDFSKLNDNATGFLDADINLTSEIVVASGKNWTLDLNGHTLDRGLTAAADNGHVLKIESGATLTIVDNSTAQTGTIRGGYTMNGGNINNAGTLNLYGGLITGGGCQLKGGGIWNHGTLNIQGNPKVTGNSGGDIYLPQGKVVNVTGAITSGANSLGISMETHDKFTSGYGNSGTTTDPFFTSYDANIIQNDDATGEKLMRIGYYKCQWINSLSSSSYLEKSKQYVPVDANVVNLNELSPTGDKIHFDLDADTWYVATGKRHYTSGRFNCKGTTRIILCNGAETQIDRGIAVLSTENASLYIYGQSETDDANHMGKLIAGSIEYAGIGGDGFATSTGNVEIHGGYVEATGGSESAGIGGSAPGGTQGACLAPEVIRIYGGKVKATGGKGDVHGPGHERSGAGIGGALEQSGGTLYIYGGDVEAYGGDYAAGIGSGGYYKRNKGQNSGDINILGGKVKAVGGEDAAGIGSAKDYDCLTITISGGQVYAYGGKHGAGIGGGRDGNGGIITISDGQVYAYGGVDGAGIGCGEQSLLFSDYRSGTIIISGGYVYAESTGKDSNAPGIGAGEDATCETITITGGTVEAKAGEGCGNTGAIGAYEIEDAGTLILADKLKVKAGESPSNIERTFSAPERVAACQRRAYAKIEVCDHPDMTYTVTATDHTSHCEYCNISATGQHELGGDGKCSVCGFMSIEDVWSITLSTPEVEDDHQPIPVQVGNGYAYEATSQSVLKGTSYLLPTCDVVLNGYTFKGWVVGAPDGSLEVPANTPASDILAPGTKVTPSGNITYTARYIPFRLYAVIDGTTMTLKGGSPEEGTIVYDGSDNWNNSFWPTITSAIIDKSCRDYNGITLSNLFFGCQKLESITGLNYLNTTKVENMSQMFMSCWKLTSLDLSTFNTAKVTDMKNMFSNCGTLKTIVVGDGWSTANVTSSQEMFNRCDKLVGMLGTTYNTNYVDKEYAHVDGGTTNPGYLTDINSVLWDNKSNSTTISTLADDNTHNIVLADRTLYKDGNWNTLCLPFNMTAEQVTAQLAPTELMELDIDGSHTDDNGTHKTGLDSEGTLYLYFKDATGGITAGKPYIIKWSNGDNIVNPTFTSVTVSNATTTVTASNSGLKTVEFIGTYSPVGLEGGDPSNLYLGSGNQLFWPSADKTIGAFRAYFRVDLSNTPSGVRAFSLHFGDEDDATGVVDVRRKMEEGRSDGWYDLSGRKLSKKPTQKGVYIRNGKKIIIK